MITDEALDTIVRTVQRYGNAYDFVGDRQPGSRALVRKSIEEALKVPCAAVAPTPHTPRSTEGHTLAYDPQDWAEPGDAAMLDWLERKLFGSAWGGTIGRPKDWTVRGDYRHTTQRMVGNTLREAIAAAMKAATP